jgi:hypothetical protein
MDPDVWPFPGSGTTMRAVFRAATWLTEREDDLLSLISGE